MGNFSDNVTSWSRRAKKAANQTIVDATIAFGEDVINNTPVKTGLARGDWKSSIDEPLMEASERPRPKVAAVSQLRHAARKLATGAKTFFFRNNQPYVVFLEYGSSQQAPNGMLRLAILKWPKFVSDAALKNSRQSRVAK